mmetsp:Transcript_10524/g.33482  ORF Transcript_10524/g.33482 Transcript_10524/m.33482 type:complete len:221 (+) Transcript_10524:66-728(+)
MTKILSRPSQHTRQSHASSGCKGTPHHHAHHDHSIPFHASSHSSGFSRHGKPYLGRNVMVASGRCLCVGESLKSNWRTSMASITLASRTAKFCPMQFRLPTEKGMNAIGWRPALEGPLRKRSGLNLSGSSHSSGLWWRYQMGIVTSMSLGMRMPPMRTGRLARRPIMGAGGNKRNASCSTMLITRSCCTCSHVRSAGSVGNTERASSLHCSFQSGCCASR